MRLIAHRGYSDVAPENTLAAFDLALKAGAEAIECDLQLTRDGQWVICHDDTVNRTSTGRGSIRRKSLEELRTFSFGYPRRFGQKFARERILTFAELVQWLRGRAHLYAEIKSESLPSERTECGLSLQCLGDRKEQWITFISFDWSVVEALRFSDSRTRLGLLFNHYQPRRMLTVAANLSVAFLMGHVRLIETHPKFVSMAHQAGFELGAYTSDSLRQLTRLQVLGVDAVATNRVGEFVQRFRGGKK